MLLSWHLSFILFLVGIWAGHVSIICSLLYGDVWQYSHCFPIFSVVGAPNLAMLILLFFLWKVILFFPVFGTIE